MKILSLFILILFNSLLIFSQPQKKDFNFEFFENGKINGWVNEGSSNYIVGLDSVNKLHEGFSASIEYKEGEIGFKTWTYILPNNYKGENIKLSGYIKTENIIDGYAGLWMRIDPFIAFDNMSKKGVKGTTDWTKYEITLTMNPEQTRNIVFGVLLTGKGKAWFDNIQVSIDRKQINKLKPIKYKIFPAEQDKEFDQSSKIELKSINPTQIDNLKTVGLIWGFLKYYHPNIANGNYNWDYELFRIIPKLLDIKSKDDRDDALIKWIKNLGDFHSNNEENTKLTEIKIKPDLEWIDRSNFSEELTNILLKVKSAKRIHKNYYIELDESVGNPIFRNENSYSYIKYPDDGFRLLSLFRYWNIIQYYLPYKNLIDEDWLKTLEEFIPKFLSTKNELEYKLNVLELIGRINDTHANIWGKDQILENYFGARYSAIQLTFIENKVIVTGFYDQKLGEETGLEIGDEILAINKIPIEEIVKNRLKYSPASNYPTKLRDIASSLLRANDSIINIDFFRNNKREYKLLKTYSIKEINIFSRYNVTDTCYRLLNDNIVYLNNGSMKKEYLPKIWKEILNSKGVIIDLRNYPSDFPLYELSNYLMPENTPFLKKTVGSIENPGCFIFDKTLKVGIKNKKYYKGKVIILINEFTQSASEFHAMGYRVHPNSTVIGSMTAGADGNVSQFYLPGGIYTMISGIGIYYPNGTETQRIGIVPDIEVKQTIQSVKNGQDELLNKATQIIYNSISINK